MRKFTHLISRESIKVPEENVTLLMESRGGLRLKLSSAFSLHKPRFEKEEWT